MRRQNDQLELWNRARMVVISLGFFLLLLPVPHRSFAGPPYVTDDPETVDYRHWELYLASQAAHDKDGWAGTGPHVEVNYGVWPNVQLHLIAPMAFALPPDSTGQYGYGDTEVGVKVRFIQESNWRPMVGIFPLLELPSGNSQNGLGSGQVQAFLPLWVQKSIGPWQTYGGGGYWINPGSGNKNYGFVGWQIQREILEHVTLGAEVFHTTPRVEQGDAETRFNIGLVWDITETQHLLLSAGRGIQGSNTFQGYFAYLFTFGPHK